MADPQAVEAARRALGRQLAAQRHAIGDTQAKLAAHLGYSRSTIANVETGRQHMTLDFWRRCDAALGASGSLVEAAEDAEELAFQQRQHLAAKAQAERQAKLRALRTSTTPAPTPGYGDDEISEWLLHRSQAEAPSVRSLEDGSSRDPVEEDNVQRRALLQLLAALGVGGAIPVDALERLRGGLDAYMEPRADLAIEDWERMAWEYGHVVIVQPTEQVVADLAVDIYEVHRLIKGTHTPLLRTGLMRVNAQLSALMADELHSLGQFGPAWRWWRTARDAADQSGDRDLRVWVRAREAINAFNSVRPTASVLALADEAVRIANGNASSGLAEAYKNRAYGMMRRGDESAARTALRDMRRAFEELPGSITSDEDSLWGWPERVMHMAESWVYTSFGAPEAAIAQERALSQYPSSWRTEVTRAKLFQSITLIHDRDMDGGLEHALASIESLPDDSHRRRPSILRVVGQVLDALPDDRARTLPAARDLQAVMVSTSS